MSELGDLKYPLLFFLVLPMALVFTLDYFKLVKKPQLPHPAGKTKKIPNLLLFVGYILALSSFVFLAYGFSLPHDLEQNSHSREKAHDIMFVFDVSRSMLAEDINPNRLESAKRQFMKFIETRTQDRIGIILFSEKVFTLAPLTFDYQLLKNLTAKVEAGGFLGSGTNIGDSLALGVAKLIKSEAKKKFIVFLSDGVSNVGNITPLQAIEIAKENDIPVYSIAYGSDKDAKLPIGNGLFGKRYQTIPGGSIDVELLKKMAKVTGGKSYRSTDERALQQAFEDINNITRSKVKKRSFFIPIFNHMDYLVYGSSLFLLFLLLRFFVLRYIE